MGTIKLTTYPDRHMFNGTHLENPEYDSTVRVFEVPKDWLAEWLRLVYMMDIDLFMDLYTWDDTHEIYEAILRERILVNTWIERRQS